MPINAPITSAIDLGLPMIPDNAVTDPAVYEELLAVYQALRTLQASIVPQYTTATRPDYREGLLIYDITIHKLVVGGAAAWEVVTSV